MDILQLGLLVLLGKLMPPLLPVQSQLRQDFKKKDDGLQALGLESFALQICQGTTAKGFYPDSDESRFFSNDYFDFKKKHGGGPQLQLHPKKNLNNHIFFGSFPQTKFSNHLPVRASLAPWEYTMHC